LKNYFFLTYFHIGDPVLKKHEIITATKVTAGSVDDGKVLKDMMALHEQNTQKKINTVVADTKYGTVDNFLNCHDQGIKAHIPSIEESHRGSGRQKGIFSREKFTYNHDTDTFTCPVGKLLIKMKFKKKRKHYEYKASAKVCNDCQLKNKCTRSNSGRTLKRHARQDELDVIVEQTKTRKSKRDLKTRQHLSERSFANSTRYGYKRSRWRRLWRMEIQDFLIAAIQNIKVLINQPKQRMSKSNVVECRITGLLSHNTLKNRVHSILTLFYCNLMFSFKRNFSISKIGLNSY
jgi:hypothetical protein